MWLGRWMTDDPSTPDLKRARALRSLARALSLHVKRGMQAGLVMHAAKMANAKEPDRFKTHPANTWHFASLRALESCSIVEISELVAQHAKESRLDDADVDEWKPLKGH
jgi:hypothetical protein